MSIVVTGMSIGSKLTCKYAYLCLVVLETYYCIVGIVSSLSELSDKLHIVLTLSTNFLSGSFDL